MKKTIFYIIILSQSWLSIGTFCAHIINPDHGLIEILNEEEKNEKEKEIENEIEKINNSEGNDGISDYTSLKVLNKLDFIILLGRSHSDNSTPPPKQV